MLGNNFRPWGELTWLLSKSKSIKWNIIGCVSFEERCYALQSRIPTDLIKENLYFNILPPESKIKKTQDDKLKENLNELSSYGVTIEQIKRVQLLENVDSFLKPIKDF